MAATGEMPELTDAPTWLIDPIDGTLNFIHTFPQSCISVGLTVRKELVLGIIYNPLSSELYTAIKGEGAFLNGKPIRTSNVTGNTHVLLLHAKAILCRHAFLEESNGNSRINYEKRNIISHMPHYPLISISVHRSNIHRFASAVYFYRASYPVVKPVLQHVRFADN